MGYVNDLTLPLKMMLKQTNLSIKESHKNILDYMRACNGLQKQYLWNSYFKLLPFNTEPFMMS